MRVLGSILLAAVVACGAKTPPQEAGVAAAAVEKVQTPTVLVAQCHQLDPDGTCRLPHHAAAIQVWIDVHGSTALSVRADDAVPTFTRRRADGGVGLRIDVPPDATRIQIDGVDPAWETPFTLPIRRWDSPPVITEVRTDLERGELDAARARLEAALPELEGDARLAVVEWLRIVSFKKGDADAGLAWSRESIDLATKLSSWRYVGLAATAVVHTAAARGDLAEARRGLAHLEVAAAHLPEAQMLSAFAQALVARMLQETTASLDGYAEAARLADRLGDTRTQLATLEGLSVGLAELSRDTEALEIAERTLAIADDPTVDCKLRADALNNAAWVNLLLGTSGLTFHDPEPPLLRSLLLADPDGECPDPQLAANSRINLARAALLASDPASALAWIDEIEDVPPRFEGWVHEVQTRAWAKMDRWDLVDSPLSQVDPDLPLELRWNAWMRNAEASEHFGFTTAAIDAYEAAEALVDESLVAIGVDGGRECFVAGRQASARGLVRLLTELGRPQEALCRARLARGRTLRPLDRISLLHAADPDKRARWEADVMAIAAERRTLAKDAAADAELSLDERERHQRLRQEREDKIGDRLDEAYAALGAAPRVGTCDDLPLLPAGEIMLASFPLDSGWVLFVHDATATTARFVDDPPEGDRRAWTEAALGPDAARLEAASRIRVLAIGRSTAVRFHELPYGDGVLLDVAPVTYTLDVAPRPSHGVTDRRAVVIADPSGDLPLAREEADVVTKSLVDAGWSVTRLQGEHASRQTVERELPKASLLHYAGHAEHGGTAGWDAALVLHESDLGVYDVLALERGPKALVLAGCDTGHVTHDTLEGGMNLGRAFVLAGADWVVVADTQVPDAVSKQLAEALYDGVSDEGWDGATALRRAQRKRRTAQPDDPDWAAFRVVVP